MKTYNKNVVVLVLLLVLLSLCSSFATAISIGNFANNTIIYKTNYSLFLNISSFDEGGTCTLTKTINDGTPTNIFSSNYIGIDRYNDYSLYYDFNNINYTYCYQEFSNVATVCGGLNTGTYNLSIKPGSSVTNPTYWNDGDWATKTGANFPHANMSTNYTIPINTNKNLSRWNVGMGAAIYNVSLIIPPSCWNRTDNKLVLRIYTNFAGVYVRCITYDDEVLQIYSTTDYATVADEAMNWSMPTTKEIVSDTQTNIKNIEETSGIIGGAVAFDGIDYLDTNISLSSNNFSVSFWLKMGDNSTQFIMNQFDADSSQGWFAFYNDYKIILVGYGGPSGDGISQSYTYTSINKLDVDEWNHIILTIDNNTASGGTRVKTFINGDKAFDYESHNFIPRFIPILNKTYIIGGTIESNFFNGSIDELKIYDYVVSDTQAQDLAKRNSFFYLDTNTSIENIFNPTMNGTILDGNKIKIVEGHISGTKALSFEGDGGSVGGSIRLGNITQPNTMNDTGISFGGWIKPQEYVGGGTVRYLYSKGDIDNSETFAYGMWHNDNTNKVGCTFMDTVYGNTKAVAQTSTIFAEAWNHVICTYNPETGYIHMYTNGELIDSASLGGLNATHYYDCIGAESTNVGAPNCDGRKYNGSIQNFGIWTKALNITEIQNLYSDNITINRYKLHQINETTNVTIDTEYIYDLSCAYDDYGISYRLTDALYLSTNTTIDNCSTNLMQTLNLTTRYIGDNALTNSTIEGYFWIYGTDENIRKEYNLTWKNGNSYGVCLSPNKTSFNLSANIFYYNDVEERTYYLNDLTVSNTSQNINLYFQNLTTQTLFYVIDENDDYIKDAYITVRRHDIGTNTDTTLYILKTDDDGSCVADLVLNTEYYSFVITYLGDTVFESSPTLILTSPKTFRVNLGTDFYDNYQQVLNVEGEVSFVNATRTFSFTFNDLGGVSTVGCLEVTKHIGSLNTLVNKTCLTTSSGTINIQITGVGTSTFVGKGYVTIGGINYLIDQFSYNFNETYKEWGDEGLFAVFFFLLTVSMVGVSMGSPPIAIALLAVGLILSVAMSIFMFSSEYVITFVILAGIAIYFTSRRTR